MPRRFRVEHRRAQTHQRRGEQDDGVVPGDAEQQQTEEGRGHADRQRKWLRLLVGEMTDGRLQQRRGELERQRDQPDLREIQRIVGLQDRIHRCDQRLHGVVEEMREADAGKHDIGRSGRACLQAGVSRTSTGAASACSETATDLFNGSFPERIRRAQAHFLRWRRFADHHHYKMAVMRLAVEHDPEKWRPVFRKDHANNEMRSWSDSI